LTESFIETEIKKYNVTDASIVELSTQYLALKVEGINDSEGCKVVHDARMAMVKKRTAVEAKRKELKKESIEFGKAVDTEAKRIMSLLNPIELHLLEQENIVLNERKRVKEENARKEQEEAERIEDEKRKEEEDRQEQIRQENAAEQERQAKVRLEQEETARKQKEVQDKIDADQQRIANDMYEREQEELRQKHEEEAKAKAEKEAEERVEREAEEKRQQEEQEKKDEELRLALLPDKEKLSEYADALKNVSRPTLQNAQSHELLSDASLLLSEAYDLLKGGCS